MGANSCEIVSAGLESVAKSAFVDHSSDLGGLDSEYVAEFVGVSAQSRGCGHVSYFVHETCARPYRAHHGVVRCRMV